jgi:hypothetical protein
MRTLQIPWLLICAVSVSVSLNAEPQAPGAANSSVGSVAIGTDVQPHDVVFAGDNVFPQVVDGAGWKTTFKLANLENHFVTFTLYFFGDDGLALSLPILDSAVISGGNYTSIVFTLAPAASITIETAGFSRGLAQGWALMQRANTNDSIGGFAIFKFRAPGIPDQEAVVPIVNQFSGHFVLLYDNTSSFVSGIAIANPTGNTVSIPVYIRDETGVIIDQQFIALGPFAHTAFVAPDLWSSTIGRAGAIEFLTSGFGVGALGLRFNGYAFTSFPVLTNLTWLQ